MRLRELVNCHGCLRATRDWHLVELTFDGRKIHSDKLCKACASDVEDGLRRSITVVRNSAVSRW